MEDIHEIKSENRNLLGKLHYKFCKENNKHLLEYLKIASENQTNSSCDNEQYKFFENLLPMDNKLKNELKEYLHRPVEVIDITQSEDGDEINFSQELIPNDKSINISVNENQSTVDDLIYAVKECLGNQKYLDSTVLNNLQSFNLDTEQVFKNLSQILNHKEVMNLGLSIISSSVTNDLVVEHYIRHLMIKEISSEFSEGLLSLLKDFSIKYADILNEELTAYLSNTENDFKMTIQFLEKVNNDFKSEILRKIVFNSIDLQEHLIGCLEVLLNEQNDYDTLNKLVDLMSSSANNYSKDKKFGKLFTMMIKYIGKSVILLEQPLKHIVNSHKSIWKSKMQKVLNDSIQDHSISTQSFRY